jgi:D-lactate dehydrogenase (cytochrome)
MAVIQYGLPVARIELLDEVMVKACNGYSKTDMPETPLLLLEFHGTQAGVIEQAEIFGALAEEFGGHGYQATTTTEERNKLWKARHDAYWAMLQFCPGKKGIATDVCVPISRLAECVGAAQRRAAELDLVAPVVGHAGDGNFHVTPMVDASDSEEVARAAEFVSWLNELAISMEGTCTGEHGIGQGKMKYLVQELGDATGVMGQIKQALDPLNILNPGKVI